MNLPSPPMLRPEDFPDVEPRLLEAISIGFRDVFAAVASVPALTFREGLTFTTGASGTAYLDMSVAQLPKHLWVSRMEADGADVTTAYSQTWVRLGGKVRLLFIGLAADTKHTCSVVHV